MVSCSSYRSGDINEYGVVVLGKLASSCNLDFINKESTVYLSKREPHWTRRGTFSIVKGSILGLKYSLILSIFLFLRSYSF